MFQILIFEWIKYFFLIIANSDFDVLVNGAWYTKFTPIYPLKAVTGLSFDLQTTLVYEWISVW